MKLFESGKIRTMVLKNRIVMDALNIQIATPMEEAALTQGKIDFYVVRSNGGAGLIMAQNLKKGGFIE